jgi:DUF2075 family protein
MIVYQSTKRAFLQDSDDRNIEDVVAGAYLQRTGRYAPEAEFRAWRESLKHMAKVLRDDEIPGDAGVGIEFGIPQSSKRIDFIISGQSEQGDPRMVIVELKQWSEAKLSEKDGIVVARRGGRAETEGPHPSYQAWSYAALLNGFNEAIYTGNVELSPCAYLHNYEADGIINDAHYSHYVERAPLFLKGEVELRRLREFVKAYVKKGDNGALLFKVENGRIRPSKMLADSLGKMLHGNEEFVLVDDQKVVFETALAIAKAPPGGRKQVVIISGGPGTGKSVVAINLLAALTKLGLLTKYVSKNAAPRSVYESKLAGSMRKAQISALFSGSGAFIDSESNLFDALVIDEAHRLNRHSGLYGNLGEHQVKELIAAARCTVFFVDDDQIVTLSDIGKKREILDCARSANAEIVELELTSQFRCGGSDGYLPWLDELLGVTTIVQARVAFDSSAFDFRVVDSPAEMHRMIQERNGNNRSRMVAGYCWDWSSKRDPKAFDIVIPEHGYARRWNLDRDGSLWIVAPDSVEEVGCIHTCQGLEVEYIGVIVGADLLYRDGELKTFVANRSRQDRSVRGYRSLLERDPGAGERIDRVIRNTYRTLMTRGLKGCFVHCVDRATQDYFKSRLAEVRTSHRDATSRYL